MPEQMIGNYQILERIGTGGMGDVYRGLDVMLEREVAIKSLRPELSQREDLIARFRSEAVAMGRLNHPNIAMVHNFLFQDNQYFLIMEYVRGQTLDKILEQRGAMAYLEAIPLLAQVLDGLEHAHRQGIVHRDIKPSNIMITPTGPKLMDFGIARILQQARQTRSGHMVGTLEYMSPEHIQGKDTDARTDIYSVGVMTYEMLTGHLPFRKNTDYEMIKAQIEEAPQPLRTLNLEIPLPLEQVVAQALEKDAARRHQSAWDFKQHLEAAIGHLSASGIAAYTDFHPSPSTDSTVSTSRRLAFRSLPFAARVGLWGLVGGIIGLTIVFGAIFFMETGPGDSSSENQTPRRGQSLAEPSASDRESTGQTSSAGNTQTDQESEYRSKSVDELRELASAGDRLAEFAMGERFGSGRNVTKDPEQALEWYRKSAEKGLAKAQYYVGIYYLRGDGIKQDLIEAEKWLKKAVEQQYPGAAYQLGMCLDQQGRYDEAISWFEKSYSAGESKAAKNIGLLFVKKKEYKEALPWLEKAAASGDPGAHFSIGMIYYSGFLNVKDYIKAKEHFEQAARHDIADAQFMLGVLYKYGQGVDVNLSQADTWFSLAVRNNYPEAVKELQSTRRMMGKE